MSDKHETSIRAGSVERKATAFPASANVPDPLRDVLSLRRWVRIAVYVAILSSEPFYFFVMAFSPAQLLAGLLVGLTIAFFAIEGAFNEMIKLRKRSAYPNVLLVELGNIGEASLAAQHGLAVAMRLLRVRAAVIALRGEDRSLRVAAFAGLTPERANDILLKSAGEADAVMAQLTPICAELRPGAPFHPAFGLVPEGVERIVVAPVIALQQPIGVIVLAADGRNSDLTDNELLVSIGIALGLSLDNLRKTDELREGQARLRTVVTGAPLVLFALDRDGAITLIEGKALDKLGTQPGQLLGRSVFDVYRDRPDLIGPFKRALSGEEVTAAVEINGVVLESRLSPVRSVDGEVTSVIGIATDVTERRRAEAALEESEARLRTVVTNVPVVLFAVDSDGTFTLSEGKGLADLGLNAGEVVGLNAFEVYRDLPEIRHNIERALKGEIVAETVKVGDLAWESIYSPVRDASGAVTSVIGVAGNVTERLRAQEALRESEERYRELIDNASDIVFAHDMDGRFFSVNSAAEMLLGYTQDEMLRLAVADITPPEFLAVVQGMTDLKVDKGGRTTYEIEVLAKDGRRVPLEVSSWLVSDGDKPVAVHGIARDITERHQAEEALRESEERTRLVLENALDAIVAIDADGAVTTWNPQAEAMFGWARDEVLGRQLSELIIPEQHREAHGRGIERYLETGEGVLLNKRVEITAVRRNGCEFPIELAISPSEGRDGITFSAFIRDITDRRKAEEALRESEEKYRDLVENSNEIIYTLDTSGVINYISPAVRQLGGYEPEEIIGKTSLSFVHPDDLPGLTASFARTVAGNPERSEYRLRTKSGGYLWVQTSSRVIYDGDRIVGLRGIIVDIDERKKAEEALRESDDRYVELFENASDLVYAHDLAGNFTSINSAITRIAGYTVDEALAMNVSEMIAPEHHARAGSGVQRAFQTGRPATYEMDIHAKAGHTVTLEVSARVVYEDGVPTGVQGIARDITERRRADVLLAGEKQVLEMLAAGESLPAALEVLVRVVEGQSSGMKCSVLLVDNGGANLRHGAAPSLPEEYNRAVDGIVIGPNVGSCGTAAHRKELVVVSDIAADPLWVDFRDLALAAGLRACWSLPIFSTRGDVLGTFAMYYDAPRTPEKQDLELIERATHIAGIAIEGKVGEQALQRSEERYRNLVNTAQDVIYTADTAAAITSLNPAFETVTGWKREDWLGKSFAPIIHPDDLALAVDLYKKVLAGETTSYELRIKKASGEYLVGEFSITPLVEEGEIKGVFGIFRDITERKKTRDTIRDLAYHDALTGLPNRALFEDRMSVALAQAHRSRQMLAVMFLDLDRFKVVNDTLGHSGGDKLLKGVADDLESILREGDTVARVGGDEFTLLLPGIAKQEDAIDIAQRILDILRGPRLIDGQEFAVTTSIGITVYPQDGADTDTLLRNADTAMYRAKERGRDNFQLYTPAMNAGVLQRLSLENDLRHALERNELRVFYQPIAETQTGRIVATEALLRWQHPERGIVNPDEFIPFAEETGLIVPIGEWVLREAMLQNRAWQDAGQRAMRVTVNLSARQLQQEDMVSIVARLLRETGLAPQHLQLEITESAVMKNVELIISMLHQIRRIGVGVSLDDFGTGYSSLSYLKRFPIDSVKIDRSFVRDIATDPNDAAIVTTVIVMARNLNLKVIAEGVETPEQLEFLQKRGCDEYQGYLISRPVEPAEIAGLLEPPRRTRAKITRLERLGPPAAGGLLPAIMRVRERGSMRFARW